MISTRQIITVLLLFQFSLSTVATIQIFKEQNETECGGNITFTCKIGGSPSKVAWMCENDVIPIANCIRGTCKLHPNYIGKYDFTYDVDLGVFNLTIKMLTKNDNGKKIVCSNGDESVSAEISIRDYKALLLEDKENETITAIFGCISADRKVLIKWAKIKYNENEESEFHPHLLFTSVKICSNDSVCSTNQQIQHSVAISAKPSIKGNYYLKMLVMYGDETIISKITTLKYNIEEQDFNNMYGANDSTVTVLIVVLLFGVFLTVIICFTCWAMLKKRSSKENSDRKRIEFKKLDNKALKRETWPDLSFIPNRNSPIQLSKSDDLRYLKKKKAITSLRDVSFIPNRNSPIQLSKSDDLRYLIQKKGNN